MDALYRPVRLISDSWELKMSESRLRLLQDMPIFGGVDNQALNFLLDNSTCIEVKTGEHFLLLPTIRLRFLEEYPPDSDRFQKKHL